MKGNDDCDNENEIMPMALAIESLCRRHRALNSNAKKSTHNSEGESNKSFMGKSHLKKLRKQAARCQATKDRFSGKTGKTAPIMFHDET
ncbi:hypothetical protein AB6D66_00500 [Vibrio pomeroyi]|uniref:Uncharacterized protein n=1 Tax=Vibrio pomeroyi TaxID=198832 RepID=A0ABV4MQV9_9VIBR|nr:hypothetical protein [Vibrio atlanticus]MCZ4311029.1 hypothetical protein [Vibrio atlanticus]